MENRKIRAKIQPRKIWQGIAQVNEQMNPYLNAQTTTKVAKGTKNLPKQTSLLLQAMTTVTIEMSNLPVDCCASVDVSSISNKNMVHIKLRTHYTSNKWISNK